jgi:hypothetical protein
MYWVYQGDNWYASSWYNGPWVFVAADVVPLYILRVPVRYYRQPPVYFRAWSPDAPPRWGEHWGGAWAQRRRGWDNWNRSSVPPPAPLPVYQRQYEGNRYPSLQQQPVLQGQHYRYQPRDTVVQQHYQAQRTQSASASSPSSPHAGKGAPKERGTPMQDQSGSSRPSSAQQGASPTPRGQPPQKESGDTQRPVTAQAPPQQGGATAKHQSQQPHQGEQQAPNSPGLNKGAQGKGSAQDNR